MQRDKLKPEDIDSDLEDHCFIGETLIPTEYATIPIKNLVGTSGKVFGINGDLFYYHNCRLTRKNASLVKVTFKDGFYVICTPDHLFYTTTGWIPAKNLLTVCGTLCIVSKYNRTKGRLWKGLQYYLKHSKNLMGKYTTYVVDTFKKMEYGSIGQYGNITTEIS